jgi:hypothetical protein
MEALLGIILTFVIFAYLGGLLEKNEEKNYRAAYKRQNGHEPSDDAVQRYLDERAEPHSRV